MNEIESTKVDKPYKPSLRLRKYVKCLFEYGTHEIATRKAGITRHGLYAQLKRNPRFREWFSDTARAYFESLSPDVHCALRDIMQGDDGYAKIRAIEVWGKISGWITFNNVKIDASRNVNITLKDLIISMQEEDKKKLDVK